MRMRITLLAGVFGLVLAGTASAQDAKQIALGDSLFNASRFGACAGCHGAAGKGSSNGPKLNDKEWLHTTGPDLEGIKGVIANGVQKPKKGKVGMPPMGGAKLTPEEIDAIAQYVVTLSVKK